MKINSILITMLGVILVADTAAGLWFRRRRCTKKNCVKSWGSWSPCNCLGDSSRRARI